MTRPNWRDWHQANDQSCVKCKFMATTIDGRIKMCRRHPPNDGWPVVQQDTDWCGEYVSRFERHPKPPKPPKAEE